MSLIRWYDSSLIPIYDMVQIGGVFENGRFVILPSLALCFMFFQPGNETSLAVRQGSIEFLVLVVKCNWRDW